VFLDRPNVIDDEMYRLAIDALGSEETAKFAIKELLPILASGEIKEASQIVFEDFEKFKRMKKL
jgi:hypothetical protein